MVKILITLILTHFTMASAIGHISYVKGIVTVNEKKVTKGHKLRVNDIVNSGKKSFAIIKLSDKSTIKLEKNSQIKINSLLDKVKPTKIQILKGSSFFKVITNKIKSKRSKFEIRTKTASLGVRGTTFFVAMTPKKMNNDTWVCVDEGIVEASRPGSRTIKKILAKQGLKVSPTQDLEDARPLPWTQALNWSFNEDEQSLNELDIKEAYNDLLDQDYD